jgi:hypothetical protein
MKGGSIRTGSYNDLQDLVICEAWMEIAKDQICGAEQKDETFWRKIFDYFHEHKNLGEHPFENDQSEASITKRWGFIQEQCTKFSAAYDQVKKRKVSGVGMGRETWRIKLWPNSRLPTNKNRSSWFIVG